MMKMILSIFCEGILNWFSSFFRSDSIHFTSECYEGNLILMTEKSERKLPRPASFNLEASRFIGGISLVLSGVIGVSDYSECEIILKSHGGRIKVRGKRLMLSIFEDKTAEIIGRIEEIGFCYGKS